jgi:hypothetical protein
MVVRAALGAVLTLTAVAAVLHARRVVHEARYEVMALLETLRSARH